MNVVELVDLCAEYERPISELRSRVEQEKLYAWKHQQRTAVVSAYIRDLGHEVEEAEAAWKAKGYGLGY